MRNYRTKIKGVENLKDEIDQLRLAGKKIVFTNGCFDILHPGHVRYLHAARALGHFLIVAVNSDESVRSIKDPDRPVMPQDARAELVAALGCVDGVIIFEEDNPLRVIQILMPDILVKGEDWAEEDIIGADVVQEGGGRVERIPYLTGYSTTGILEKIRGEGR